VSGRVVLGDLGGVELTVALVAFADLGGVGDADGEDDTAEGDARGVTGEPVGAEGDGLGGGAAEVEGLLGGPNDKGTLPA
jgi:hypothetical protein